MKKKRQNVRSTKQTMLPNGDDTVQHSLSKHHLLVKVVNAHNTVYTDQTGNFPIQSSRGKRLLMLFYDVDGNYIDVKPMKDHKDNSMIAAYKSLWSRVTKLHDVKPNMHNLDNEALEAFKVAIETNCNLQLVPPNTHRRNLAKRAIQTFKSHVTAILAGVDPDFPMYLWDPLLPQAVSTLNLLCQAHTNPSRSAYEYVNGAFDYYKMPLAPLGCAVQMHEAANRRKTWDPRSLTGWHLGTLPEHYQWYRFFCQRTRSERISDTVIFQHQHLTNLNITPEDMVIKAIRDVKSILLRQSNTIGTEEQCAIKQLLHIFSSNSADNKQLKQVTFQDLTVHHS
jgi:hypothetical protein